MDAVELFELLHGCCTRWNLLRPIGPVGALARASSHCSRACVRSSHPLCLLLMRRVFVLPQARGSHPGSTRELQYLQDLERLAHSTHATTYLPRTPAPPCAHARVHTCDRGPLTRICLACVCEYSHEIPYFHARIVLFAVLRTETFAAERRYSIANIHQFELPSSLSNRRMSLFTAAATFESELGTRAASALRVGW